LNTHRSCLLGAVPLLLTLCCGLASAQTYAVLPLCNLTGDKSLDGAAYGIPATLTDALRYVPKIRLVERLRINEVLQEKDLGDAGLLKRQVSAREALELGKLLTADYVFVGEYERQPQSSLIRVYVRCVGTAMGDPEVPGSLLVNDKCLRDQGEAKELFRLEDRLGRQLLEQGFKQKAPDSFLAHDPEAHHYWSQGWQHFYAREYDRAEICFQKAAELDHNFEPAQQTLAFMKWTGDKSLRAMTYLGACDRPFEATFAAMKRALQRALPRYTGENVDLEQKQARLFGRTKMTLLTYGTDVEVELKGFGEWTGVRLRAKKKGTLVDIFGEAEGLLRDILKRFDEELRKIPTKPAASAQ